MLLPPPFSLPSRYGRVWIATIGMVVGCLVPPAGSIVIASWSPGWTSSARTGEVARALLPGSSPTERALAALHHPELVHPGVAGASACPRR